MDAKQGKTEEKSKHVDEQKKHAEAKTAKTQSQPDINYIKKTWKEYEYPIGYKADDNRVFREIETEDGEQDFETVTRTPFILCGKTEQLEDGHIYCTIRYKSGNAQNEFVSDIFKLLIKQSLKTELTGHGINASDNEILSEAIEYISKSISEFGDNLHIEKAIQQNGWNEDFSLFAMGKIGITANGMIQIHTLVDTDKHILPFHTKGTFEGWTKAVTPSLAFPKPRYIFYDGMAAPLIRILNIEQNTLVIVGDTSTGKTGTVRVVSFTLGNPSDKKRPATCLEYIVGDSHNPLLAHASGMNDMPVHFDEATGEKAREAVSKASYQMNNGAEKQRAEGGQRAGKLRNDVSGISSSVQITCEKSLTEHMRNAGGRYRTKELRSILPVNDDVIGKMVNDTKEGISENYGFFFPVYIQKIMNDIPRVK